MQQPPPPTADVSMLVYLLAASGVVAGLTYVFFAVLMAPTVLKSVPATPLRAAQSAILLSPIDNKARADTERLVIAKAEAMNAKLGLRMAAKNAEGSTAARAEVTTKQKRVSQARKIARAARVPSYARENPWAYSPQRSFAMSWW